MIHVQFQEFLLCLKLWVLYSLFVEWMKMYWAYWRPVTETEWITMATLYITVSQPLKDAIYGKIVFSQAEQFLVSDINKSLRSNYTFSKKSLRNHPTPSKRSCTLYYIKQLPKCLKQFPADPSFVKSGYISTLSAELWAAAISYQTKKLKQANYY